MKILTVIYDLDKGGTQRAAQIFAEAYKNLGHDSRVLTLYGLGQRYEEIKDKIKVWFGLSEENLAEMADWAPEIIHIHSHGLKEEDVSRILSRLKRDNVKVVEQNVFSAPTPWTKNIDISFQFSNWALGLYNLRGGSIYKSALIPNPVDCDKFCHQNDIEIKRFRVQNGISDEAFVIGRIGQACSGKWSLMLIYAFNILAKTHLNLFLVVVCCPPDILQEINRSPFKDRIKYISEIIGDQALSVAYSSFDLMVHIAEIGESFGYVLAESLLCETPVITLSTPWGDNSQCEVVGNSLGGYVVNTQSGIVKAVEHYMKYPGKLKVTGREHIRENYDSIKVATKALNSLTIKEKNRKYDIVVILRDTFDKTSWLTILIIKMNNLHLRKLTAYRYPIKILVKKIFKKISSWTT